MEHLPHVVLVGDGAVRFAAEIGMLRENLLTDHSERVRRAGLKGRTLIDWQEAPELLAALLKRSAALTQDPEHVTGTVNFFIRRIDRGALHRRSVPVGGHGNIRGSLVIRQ
jgi:beta-aspartyl-peptidase (threonine type)